MIVFVCTWGWGPAHFVTKPITVPASWDDLLLKNRGWESPIIRKM